LLEIKRDPGHQEKKELTGAAPPDPVGQNPAQDDRQHGGGEGQDPPTHDKVPRNPIATEEGGGGADRLKMERTISVEVRIDEPTFCALRDITHLPLIGVR